MATLVPEILFGYLSLFRPHFNKPSFVFFSGYILSLLLTGGRKTMSHVAQTCFWVDRHRSAELTAKPGQLGTLPGRKPLGSNGGLPNTRGYSESQTD